ncbi:gamma-glutamylputrescine oxidoreductase [Roseovarius sp. A-2]|uniref:NAD(P)/FAD-dependent oxidoreductase n=1 Tax=Roseovarius sp. A-2 TaxID=1570360 RepID=UPI0009B56A7A|nr:FAD-binding oxidoreductase [Roseovarius sp. A-2]GAW35606.1 gamma-glutamylputrescine oxidoreductase [Roseovarius sp. A-2]
MSGPLSSLWQASAAEVFAAPALQGERSVDLAIVGGGYTGLSAALEGAGQGADVTLLEAETVGHGGSGRNVGLVNAGLWLPPDEVCKTLGQAAGERLNSVLAGAPDVVFDLIARHAIACEPVRNGTLHLAHAPKGVAQLRERLAQMQARGAPVRLLDHTEIAARTGTDRFHGGLHDPRAGTIQPLAYARGLARAAARQGARLHEQSPVTAATRHGGQWVIHTPGGKLRAKHLLMATNAYHCPAPPVRLPEMPVVQFYQLATEPLGDNLARDILAGGEGCWDTGLVMTSLRRDAVGRIILGGMGGEASAHADWAERKLVQLFPRLRGTGINHAWAGRIAMTGDHLPRIQRIGQGGLAVYGYSGRGIAPGTVFGRAAARALLNGQEDDLPVRVVEAHREPFAGLRTLYYETGARMVHLIAARG